MAREREKRARAPQAVGEGSQSCAVEGGGLRGSSGGSRARVGVVKVFEWTSEGFEIGPRARAKPDTHTRAHLHHASTA